LTATLQAAGGSGQWRESEREKQREETGRLTPTQIACSHPTQPNPPHRFSLLTPTPTPIRVPGRCTSTLEVCTVAHQVTSAPLLQYQASCRCTHHARTSTHPAILWSNACLQRKLSAFESRPPEQYTNSKTCAQSLQSLIGTVPDLQI
jgi:hypothetical protein